MRVLKLTHGKPIVSESCSTFVLLIQFLLATDWMLYKIEGLEEWKAVLESPQGLRNVTRHCHICYYSLIQNIWTQPWSDLFEGAVVQCKHSPGGERWCRSSAGACSWGCGTRERTHPPASWNTPCLPQSSASGHWAQSPAACNGWAVSYLLLLKMPLLTHLLG